MPKLDLDSIDQMNRTGYPPPYNAQVAGRWYRRLAPPSGLTDFGVSEVTLDRNLKTAIALLEPLMLGLIAALIGTIFISMVLPIFTIQDYIK